MSVDKMWLTLGLIGCGCLLAACVVAWLDWFSERR